MKAKSVKVQFSRVLFYGKPAELQDIMKIIWNEFLMLIQREKVDDDDVFMLIMDLHTARTAYNLATGLMVVPKYSFNYFSYDDFVYH